MFGSLRILSKKNVMNFNQYGNWTTKNRQNFIKTKRNRQKKPKFKTDSNNYPVDMVQINNWKNNKTHRKIFLL